MFNNRFKFDAAADLAKSILEADTKAKMEALKGDQEKLDKNRNGKLDAHDFKILRGEKKVNEAEADYQSSYRVGKTANFKPKVSDVGQGRKITGKMGKYGKQPDDDNMVEPPPEHKVGDVKTDPSAVVPGHSTMGAKLHLASLPKDAEGNTIHKGARRVNAADLVAKRKAMMSGQKNEEVESLDEISIKTKMGAYASTQDPDADQGYGDKVHDQGDRIRAAIAKKHGETMAKHADAHASASHYGRKDASGKYKTHAILARDKLSKDSSSPQRITKSGKLHAQDVKTLKNTIRSRNEEVESIEEGMEDTLHPAGAALLKHIKPQHHNLYKPHLTKDVFNGGFSDRHAVLKAAQDAGHLKMDLKKQNEEVEELDERELTSGETSEKERIVHGMKKSLKGFKARYGDRAKEVMYATATAKAKK